MNTEDKPIITKQQAEAIEHWINNHIGGKESLIKGHINSGSWIGPTEALNRMPLDTLIRALYFGYEIEASPEERLVEYIRSLQKTPSLQSITKLIAVADVLKILGIDLKELKGVKANAYSQLYEMR